MNIVDALNTNKPISHPACVRAWWQFKPRYVIHTDNPDNFKDKDFMGYILHTAETTNDGRFNRVFGIESIDLLLSNSWFLLEDENVEAEAKSDT
jgi:hypothetical protein